MQRWRLLAVLLPACQVGVGIGEPHPGPDATDRADAAPIDAAPEPPADAAGAVVMAYRINGQTAGAFSCSDALSFAIHLGNPGPVAITISAFAMEMISQSGPCQSHVPPVDGRAFRFSSLAPGASGELRRVDLAGDLCIDFGQPGCSWEARVEVDTSAGRVTDQIVLATTP